MAKRLLQVPGAEVGFSHRRAEILIAGRSCISTGSIGLYSLTAHPDESTGRIDIDVSPWAHYVLSGDDSAREAAESLIRAEPADRGRWRPRSSSDLRRERFGAASRGRDPIETFRTSRLAAVVPGSAASRNNTEKPH